MPWVTANKEIEALHENRALFLMIVAWVPLMLKVTSPPHDFLALIASLVALVPSIMCSLYYATHIIDWWSDRHVRRTTREHRLRRGDHPERAHVD